MLHKQLICRVYSLAFVLLRRRTGKGGRDHAAETGTAGLAASGRDRFPRPVAVRVRSWSLRRAARHHADRARHVARRGVGSQTLDLTAEIARLRGRLAANSAQEQHCLAGATQPVWTASLASDLKALRPARTRRPPRARAPKPSAGESSRARPRRSRHARPPTREPAPSCSRASRSDSTAWTASRPSARRCARPSRSRWRTPAPTASRSARPASTGPRGCARICCVSRNGAARCRPGGGPREADAGAGAEALKAEMADLKRRNTAVLEGDPARAMADPALRAAEALVATTDAWDRERAAVERLGAAGTRRSVGRPRWSGTRPRDRHASTGPAPSGCSAGGDP